MKKQYLKEAIKEVLLSEGIRDHTPRDIWDVYLNSYIKESQATLEALKDFVKTYRTLHNSKSVVERYGAGFARTAEIGRVYQQIEKFYPQLASACKELQEKMTSDFEAAIKDMDAAFKSGEIDAEDPNYAKRKKDDFKRLKSHFNWIKSFNITAP